MHDRGDNVNGISIDDRLPDPERLLLSYFHSASTVNHVRSLLASGFAQLPSKRGENVPWSLPLSHVRSPELLKSYEGIVEQLGQALEFMSVVGAGKGTGNKKSPMGALESAEIFMSHEVRFSQLHFLGALLHSIDLVGTDVARFDKNVGFDVGV